MNKKLIFLLVFITLLHSCKKNPNEEAIEESKREVSTSKEHHLVLEEKLTSQSKTFLKDWPEYQNLNDFLENNKNYSIDEALSYADELSTLAQQLKDSIRIESLQTPDIQVRLNVIYNEALRLSDMSEIPSISEEEVIKEYSKVFEAFSALNSKINNNIHKEKLNSELKDFIEEVSKDSQNVNSVIEEPPVTPK